MIKKILICLTLALMLFSCGKKDDDGVIKLKFWHLWGGYEGKYLQSLVDEFNESHPHIHVDTLFVPLVGDKLMASIAGKVPPDVATIWDWMLTSMGESGCFMPLDDKLKDAGYTADSYMPNLWRYGVFDKQRWGVPVTVNTTAIMVNNNNVRDAGLDPDQLPQDMETLRLWARKMTKYDDKGELTQMGFLPGEFTIWVQNFGGSVYNHEEKKLTYDSPECIEALEFMASFYEEVGMSKWRRFSSSTGDNTAQDFFFTGKIAMKEDGQWKVAFAEKEAPDLDYSTIPYVSKDPSKHPTSMLSGSFWSIPVGCKHPEEAWEFLSWLMAPEQSGRFAAKIKNIPPLREAVNVPEYQEVLKDENFKFFVDIISEGHALPRILTPVSNELTLQFSQGAQKVLSGKVGAKEFLTQFNTEMQRKLDQELKYLGGGK